MFAGFIRTQTWLAEGSKLRHITIRRFRLSQESKARKNLGAHMKKGKENEQKAKVKKRNKSPRYPLRLN